MKKIILVLLCLLLISCTNEKFEKIKSTNIKLNNNLDVEYASEIYLYDLISIENGSIITQNHLIDTSILGNKNITIEYKDKDNNTKEYNFFITVKDSTPPLILHSKKYTIKVGDKIDLVSKTVCGDNYDKKVECKVDGEYDISKSGTYNLKFVANDSDNNYYESEFTLVVVDELNESNYTSNDYKIEDLITKYKNDKTQIGIDVSSWQGNVDWEKVKASGVEFVIIRIGYGHDKNNEMVIDKKFEYNLKEAKRNGIKVGIYFYSYALTNENAIEQANWVIKMLNKETLDLPIAFDWESWSSFNKYNISFTDLNNIAFTFMKTIEENGYEAMNYGSAKYLERIWKTDNYPTWLAYYTSNNDYEKEYYIWQLTNEGKVDGINGYVDLNILNIP